MPVVRRRSDVPPAGGVPEPTPGGDRPGSVPFGGTGKPGSQPFSNGGKPGSQPFSNGGKPGSQPFSNGGRPGSQPFGNNGKPASQPFSHGNGPPSQPLAVLLESSNTAMATRVPTPHTRQATRGTPMQLSRAGRVALEQRIHARMIGELRDSVDLSDPVALHSELERLFNRYMSEEDVVLSRMERGKVFEQVVAEIMGYGPIQQLLNNDSISEIMVNGPQQVWVERDGKISLSEITFQDEDHVMRIISRIVAPLGRRIDEASPMVDARLPDGSRVNAIIPPLSLIGPILTIRKFRRVPLSVEDLMSYGTLTNQSVIFLEAAVRAGLNVLVAGGTSSGKTTLLNVLSSFIPEDERIITIEDAAELQLQQVHVIPLEARPPSLEGQNAVTIRDLVTNCLRMRPDRIVVGECRSKEALDMLQAMNTGHDGCMTTVHSNSPRDALSRIETMALMAAPELPLRAIREQIAAAFDLIIYCERLDDESRKVSFVTEVQGFEQDTILLQNIFQLETIEREGQRMPMLMPTGLRPQVMRKIERARIFLAPDFFLAPHQAPGAPRNGRG